MPWGPSNPAGLFQWIENAGEFNDLPKTVPCSNGDTVAAWADQKNANDYTQSIGGSRPVFNTNLQNSLPGITFNDAAFALNGPSFLTGNKSHHIFIVFKPAAFTNPYNSLMSYGVGVANGGAIFLKSNGLSAWFIPNVFGSSYYSYDGGTKTYVANTPYVIEAICDQVGGTGTTYQNGVQDGTLTIGGAIDGGSVTDGHILGNYSAVGSYYTGSILEFLPYQAVLNNSDRNLAGSYLANKWNISTSYTGGSSTFNPYYYRLMQGA